MNYIVLSERKIYNTITKQLLRTPFTNTATKLQRCGRRRPPLWRSVTLFVKVNVNMFRKMFDSIHRHRDNFVHIAPWLWRLGRSPAAFRCVLPYSRPREGGSPKRRFALKETLVHTFRILKKEINEYILHKFNSRADKLFRIDENKLVWAISRKLK